MKLYISKPDDRDAVIVVLARNGYTVRQRKEKKPGEKTCSYFVEVVEDDRISASGHGRQVEPADVGP